MYLIPYSDLANQSDQGRKSRQYSSYNELNDLPGLGRKITLGKRCYCAFLGFLFGCLTFLIWLVEISIGAVMFDSTSALESFEIGIWLSVMIAVVLGAIGFAMGVDRFFDYMRLLWGVSDQSGGGLFLGWLRLKRIVLFLGGVILFIYYLGVRGEF